MAFSGETWGKAKKYVDTQIPLYLTSGATPKGSWDADTNTPTLTQGVGSVGEYYDVVAAGEWEGIQFLVGDRVIFSAKNKWERVPTGVESDTPIVVEYVDGSIAAFPTKRRSGNALMIGDYVGVRRTAVLPFTIGGIKFDSYSDQAVWNGTSWQEQSYNVGKTNEVLVNDKADESISGKSEYQSAINIEVKQKFTDVLSLINTLNDEYKKAGFTFNATTTDTNGVRKIVLNVYDKNGNILLNKTLANFVLSERTIAGYDLSDDITAQEIQDAIKDLPAELTNKTIDCGTFF